jgi:hypothetical protein
MSLIGGRKISPGVYLAGALHLLHKDAEAERLIDSYKMDNRDTIERDDFCQPLGMNSQYIAVIAREFPARLRKISAEQFEHILKPIGMAISTRFPLLMQCVL